MADRAICSIEGCDKLSEARGWCAKHYKRWYANGDPLISRYMREGMDLPCSVANCDAPRASKGMCSSHYQSAKSAPLRLQRQAAHAAIQPLKETDAAYIAGMVDADGMITVVRREHLVMPMVCVTNSHYPLIEWLLATIGAGCAYEQKSEPKRPDQSKERWSKVHRYQLTGRKAQSLLALIRPHLRVKQRQADLVFALPQRSRDFSLALNDNQRAQAAEILTAVRSLNKRGVKAA